MPLIRLPWRFIVRRAARAYGVIDPITLLARMRQFSQPSEVAEPIELVRAGIVFHARGLVNTKAIQHNLDWVWPYWVVKQFDPNDASFIPRGFSFSHINLTHRNWTTIGQPGWPLYPIVDPRGLVTPLHDGWSLDFWVLDRDGQWLLPSYVTDVEQWLELEPEHCIHTRARADAMSMDTRVWLEVEGSEPCLRIDATGWAQQGGWLVISARPYNPEGVQFIDSIEVPSQFPGWTVNRRTPVEMNPAPVRYAFSTYSEGDVYHHLREREHDERTSCPVGMGTAAALFPIEAAKAERVALTVPLGEELRDGVRYPVADYRGGWADQRARAAQLSLPDERITRLYDIGVATLIQHSAEDIYPGPYTYRRFWFRDACFILNALLGLGIQAPCRRALDDFPTRQRASGYFRSQEGEWDSNGQVLWIYQRYTALTGDPPAGAWLDAIERGVRWIEHKRLPEGSRHGYAGLFPAGFSAEHLGPNDYYFWDDFWGIAGLRAAADLLEAAGRRDAAYHAQHLAEDFEARVIQVISNIPERQTGGAVPAAPDRRMDAGAVGSLVADYPLQLFAPGDPRMRNTVEYLLARCMHRGGFFQDMIHSGINAYLTLHLAQCLLRAGEVERAQDLIRTVASLASSTGQWPEAIHPITLGGCMGDGQHVWAAAEWVLMLRSCFVREEGDGLVIGAGIFPEWLEAREPLRFGPTLTPFGQVSVSLEWHEDRHQLQIDAKWRRPPARLELAVPGYRPAVVYEAGAHGLVPEEI